MTGRRPNNTGSHRSRSFRCPDDVWEAAQARAERDGVTLTSALVEWLREYGSD